ncbi:MAG: class II fructose-bisphosphate aldolase [Oscillibacter sp.]|nr:class II fructose-bisphosphate aldolase [Oscillibacter sp.]
MECDKPSILTAADRAGFAVPAFNYSDIWELLSIAEAAIEERAPVYIAANMRVAETIGLEYLGAMGRTAYDLSGGRIFNHLDHSSSVELCKRAVDCGYLSVMIDASMCPLEENIEKTSAVVAYAHRYGVAVEAEIGRILGRNAEGAYLGEDYLVCVADAVRLARETGVDSLAVGIGTAHGFYRQEPNVNLQRLREVNDAVSIPLVLHGGTGVPAETVRSCIRNGIAKVNVGTQLHAVYLEELRRQLGGGPACSVSDIMNPIKAAIRPVVKDWIHICGAENRY